MKDGGNKKRKAEDASDDASSQRPKRPQSGGRGNNHAQTVLQIKDLFEKQAQLWKYHATRMEQASTVTTATLARQAPWSKLVNPTTNSTAVAVLKESNGLQQLTSQIDEISNRCNEPENVSTPDGDDDDKDQSSFAGDEDEEEDG